MDVNVEQFSNETSGLVVQSKNVNDVNSNRQDDVCTVNGINGIGGTQENEAELQDVVRQQKDELEYYKRQLAINEHKYLTDVNNLQSQIQSLTKTYETAKHEKEAAFMRYVLKEKEILDLNTEKKKLLGNVKEKEKEIVRLKANAKEHANCLSILETKNKELKETKACLETLKEDKLKISKELEHWKTKYDQNTKCSQETESKLLREVQELQNKLEMLIKENEAFNLESNLEKIVLQSQLYLTLNESSSKQLQQVRMLNSTVEELKTKLNQCSSTISLLENANIDLKTLMESNEIRTKELLIFSENLSSLNASLQSENKSLQLDLNKLQSDNVGLKQKNADLKIAFEYQKNAMSNEKEMFDQDKKQLASHLAQKMKMVSDLKKALESTQDDLHVSKCKFKTTVAELTKELQKKNVFETSAEMKMILDKMVKLQQENARLCEKLDFVEDHNRHLLSELKKNRVFVQRHGLSDKNGPVKIPNSDDLKNKRY
ncbi:coiled-coil domain-containing protein 186 [Adelges cooleyi]|uniref:coiled-coil domain-containing protein 186 n=1 Tax=Adelges cooleyi TaxID=133065 RepID=UPI00217FA810|nr:coiled-coil domain-containing protein 186 [Adelges cooleyi]